MILRNHIFRFSQMKVIIFLTLFIWFKKVFFRFKYCTGKNLRNNLFNFITLNEDNLRRLEQEKSKYCCHRKLKYRNGWSTRKTNLLQRLGCPALMLEQKRDNRVTLFLQLYFVSLYRWRRFVFLSLRKQFLWIKEIFLW